jgi:hypothetical protein
MFIVFIFDTREHVNIRFLNRRPRKTAPQILKAIFPVISSVFPGF